MTVTAAPAVSGGRSRRAVRGGRACAATIEHLLVPRTRIPAPFGECRPVSSDAVARRSERGIPNDLVTWPGYGFDVAPDRTETAVLECRSWPSPGVTPARFDFEALVWEHDDSPGAWHFLRVPAELADRMIGPRSAVPVRFARPSLAGIVGGGSDAATSGVGRRPGAA